MPKKVVSFSLSPTVIKNISDLAKALGVSRSKCIETILTDKINQISIEYIERLNRKQNEFSQIFRRKEVSE